MASSSQQKTKASRKAGKLAPKQPKKPVKSARGKGSYDIRKGASGYATIMGSIAGFVVPTVLLAFTVPGFQRHHHQAELTLATGLLVLSLLGCLVSAFAFSALSGEETLTINLPAAAMFIAVGVIFSVISVLGAFEIFAHIFLAPSAPLFAAITVGGAMAGVVFNALSVVDDWELRCAPEALDAGKGWFADRSHAVKWTRYLAGIGLVPILIGGVLFWLHAGISLSTRLASWFAFFGVIVTMAVVMRGVVRSLHPSEGTDHGIRRYEAIGLQLVTGVYALFLLSLLPSQ